MAIITKHFYFSSLVLFSRKFVVSIAFARSKDGKSTKLYEIFTSLTIACTGFDPKDIWG